MRWKLFFGVVFVLIVVSLLGVYWFIPLGEINFGTKSGNSNFSVGNSSFQGMQFYENMRFPNSKISYRIHDCSLQKRNDMERGFDMLANLTNLNFYAVESGEEISVVCDEKIKMEGSLFIAGEGGPTNITVAGNFNVILNGGILLLKDSSCSNPNIAIHELLHVLGFEHSSNENNIMYPVSDCKQIIGQDIIDLINKLYSVQNYPDLSFENVSAVMRGKYLDVNMTVRNNGLSDAEISKIKIYADGKLIKELDVDAIMIGFGTTIKLSNLWISQISVDELKFFIEYNYEELDKKNNEIILNVSE